MYYLAKINIWFVFLFLKFICIGIDYVLKYCTCSTFKVNGLYGTYKLSIYPPVNKNILRKNNSDSNIHIQKKLEIKKYLFR